MKLSGLYVQKNTVALGYPVLESFLSSYQMTDEQILCVDPTSDEETIRLAKAVEQKFSTARVVWFKWPEKTSDGSAIGIATNFAKAQATGTHVVNIQSDEVWSPPLLEWGKTEMRNLLSRGGECIRFKILHTEWNAQCFQGGETWDGRKDTDVWRRGGLFNGSVGGAGYNMSIKAAKNCSAIRSAHDGWQWEGCALIHHADVSDQWPIVHLHDMMRDHYIALRKNAGYTLWADSEKYGFYKADADRVESTKDAWFNNPKWTESVSPFDSLLPDFVKPLIGQTTYKVRYELLDSF